MRSSHLNVVTINLRCTMVNHAIVASILPQASLNANEIVFLGQKAIVCDHRDKAKSGNRGAANYSIERKPYLTLDVKRLHFLPTWINYLSADIFEYSEPSGPCLKLRADGE